MRLRRSRRLLKKAVLQQLNWKNKEAPTMKCGQPTALQDVRKANGTLRPPSRQRHVAWCCEAWNQIPRRVIIKGFLNTKLLTPEHFRDAEADASDSDEQIPLDGLEDFYVARDLPELLRDEVDDDLRDGIESESEAADDSQGVICKWRDFEAHLAEQELVLEKGGNKPDARHADKGNDGNKTSLIKPFQSKRR